MASTGVGTSDSAAVNDGMKIEKNAGLVMATNNSSIVSKRSVEKLYLPEPHFFRYFVKKPIRRAPTINRGYWLRMRAIDWVVRQFLEKPSTQGKVIINFGCGYDPMPFQWLARDPELCGNTKFVDVDYDLLMETKRDIIQATPKMRDLLHPCDSNGATDDPSILFDSEEYTALGCDLRNLPRLGRLLRKVVDIEDCLVLCVAEVSITYMQTEAADSLISWSSTLSPDVTFCLLEQCSPDQMDNPFTMTMMKHFAKLGTPLRSVVEYPGQHAQTQRFRTAGFARVDFNNLWQLWSDPRFLTPSQRCALDRIEPFDEWEEFALFASHYCLVVAHNRNEAVFAERPLSRRDSTVSLDSDISARTSSPHRPNMEWFGMHYYREPGDLCQRHHASAYLIPNQDAIGVHGGVGPRSRLATTAVTRPRHRENDDPVLIPPVEIGARCCHTITPLDSGQNLLVGGRGSPSSVFKDCWLQTGDIWERVHDLPEPRYRHRVVPVVLPDNRSGAIIFGGKTDPIHVASEILLWEPDRGWRLLRTGGPDPVPRFGQLFLRLGYNHGLLFGGLRQDGVICQGVWRWKLKIRNNQVAHIEFRTTNALDASAGVWPWFARFGASYSIQRDEVVLIGGIAKMGCIPTPYEILSLIGCFSNYKTHENELPLRIGCINPIKDPDCPRPFLVGHSTHRTRSGLSITLGGGATCFSFGNYFNTGIWVLYDQEAGLATDWIITPVKVAKLEVPKEKDEKALAQAKEISDGNAVPSAVIHSVEDFASLIHWDQPRVLKGLEFGACKTKWTLAYLKDKIPRDRNVVIHDSPARTMNFQRKDFAYRNLPFHHFLSILDERGSHLYLRSLASENPSSMPANFNHDWPEIAADFEIPTPMKGIETSLHSSPLRISNDINIWLHYDVMANVLFQIRGVKKLVLFPPQDIPRLGFPAGSTSSEMDLFNSADPDKESQLLAPDGTHPLIAILRPGDALFIPPLWSHSGLSLADGSQCPQRQLSPSTSSSNVESCASDSSSRPLPPENPFLNIAVNVFFRSLPPSSYAAGRDVYGNRDLACYEDGRKTVEKLISKFKDSKKQADSSVRESTVSLDFVPKDIRRSYLLRLAKELEDQAQNL